MMGALIERRNLDTDTHRKIPCEDKCRNVMEVMLPQSKKMAEIVSKPSEARRAAWNRLLPTALRRNQPC